MVKSFFSKITVQIICIITLASILLFRCTNPTYVDRYIEEGLDKVIKQNQSIPNFTVILNDMNYAERKYLHKYQVITMSLDSTFKEDITGWLEVSPSFFKKHQENLGMEIASKTDGKLDKNTAPAGYSQYVGNPRYGSWEERDGGSFWRFYARYALLRTAFSLLYRPVPYQYWNNYNRDYRRTGRPYYGSGNYYGTRSYVNNTEKGKQSTWGRQPATFKEQVRNRVKRSTYNNTSRTSRTNSRYSSSSSRSRSSGGFGK